MSEVKIPYKKLDPAYKAEQQAGKSSRRNDELY